MQTQLDFVYYKKSRYQELLKVLIPRSSSLKCGSLVKPHPQTTLVNNHQPPTQHLQMIEAKATYMRVYREVALRPDLLESLTVAYCGT